MPAVYGRITIDFDREQLIFLVAGMITAGMHANSNIDLSLDDAAVSAVEQAKLILRTIREHI